MGKSVGVGKKEEADCREEECRSCNLKGHEDILAITAKLGKPDTCQLRTKKARRNALGLMIELLRG